LPDHLHCIWTLPPNDTDFATRWRLIKTWFTKNWPEALRSVPDAARAAKHEQAVWQHRYWEHLVRDDHDYHGMSITSITTPSSMDWPRHPWRGRIRVFASTLQQAFTLRIGGKLV
jgi:putative transposase